VSDVFLYATFLSLAAIMASRTLLHTEN